LLLERVEVGEVVGGEELALDDGEVDLGLVEPGRARTLIRAVIYEEEHLGRAERQH
jgi:hypothetical protein